MGVSIRELSDRSGVKVPTIRYYERQGLLPEPVRTGSGQRRYGSVDVARLRFVRFGRGLGLEIGEIRSLIEMVGEGDGEAIIVLAEAVTERAGRLLSLSAALRSVSAAVVGGAIDEAGAFVRLVEGGSGGSTLAGEVPAAELSEGPIASSEPVGNADVITTTGEEMPSNHGEDREAPGDGGTSTMDPTAEGSAPEAQLRRPVRKRTRAKS